MSYSKYNDGTLEWKEGMSVMHSSGHSVNCITESGRKFWVTLFRSRYDRCNLRQEFCSCEDGMRYLDEESKRDEDYGAKYYKDGKKIK
jgi:hypothetical protein